MTLEAIAFAAVRGAFVLGLALAAMPLLRRASAATRRLVLVSAFAIVVILPFATAALPSLHLRGAPAPIATSERVASAAPEVIVQATGAPGSTATLAPPPPAPSTPANAWAPSPLVIVGGLWALGALVVLGRLGVGLARARRIASTARLVEVRHIDPPAARGDAASAGTSRGVAARSVAGARATRGRSRSVEVRSTAALDTPAVTGLFQPVILLPREADHWTDERRELVIAHELAHVARRDCLASALAQIAVAMHWFDPLAWIAARRLRIERELAADDHVLDGGATASRYAEHLLALALAPSSAHDPRATSLLGADRVPSGALAMAEPAQVSVRIRALLAPDRSRAPMSRVRRALFAAAGGALAMLVACATPDREPAPPAIRDASARTVPAEGTPSPPAIPDAGAAGETIDPRVQAIVDEEADRLVAEWRPRGAVVIVLDPATSSVLGLANRGSVTAQRSIVTGSTFKPFVVAAALEERAIAATDRFDLHGGELVYAGKPIHDASKHRVLDVSEILATSSNVGLAKIFDKLGGARLADWARRFRLADTSLTVADRSVHGVSVAIGGYLAPTPLQLAAAYAAIANGGTYHAPSTTKPASAGERVLSRETAAAVLAMLEGVVTGDKGTGSNARVEGVRVAGKTGTARLDPAGTKGEYYASFVGTAPVDAPRYVILVAAEAPRDGGAGGKVAAPVFSRITSRLLAR